MSDIPRKAVSAAYHRIQATATTSEAADLGARFAAGDITADRWLQRFRCPDDRRLLAAEVTVAGQRCLYVAGGAEIQVREWGNIAGYLREHGTVNEHLESMIRDAAAGHRLIPASLTLIEPWAAEDGTTKDSLSAVVCPRCRATRYVRITAGGDVMLD